MLQITDVDWIGDRSHQITRGSRSEVERKIKEFIKSGKPPDINPKQLETFSDILGERGDILLYPDARNLKQAQQIFDNLTTAIAILAFVPGGIEIFGTHYQAAIDGCSKT